MLINNTETELEIKRRIREEKIKKELLQNTIENICLQNINFDKLSNKSFDIVLYLRDRNNKWIKYKQFKSENKWYIVNNKLYFRSESIPNTLILVNTNFERESDNACYQIIS